MVAIQGDSISSKWKLQGFGKSVFDFSTYLLPPPMNGLDFTFINPFKDECVVNIQREFCSKFYKGKTKRIGIFGINPGRLGAGITGVPFTDPKNLKEFCRINSLSSEGSELSSEYIYSVIQSMGGVKSFYQKFYVGSVCPLGLLVGTHNANYYDSPALIKHLRPWIAKCMEAQINMGLRRDMVIVLGAGKNAKFFANLNDEFSFFKNVYILDHPRYIMQYKRKQLPHYREKYKELLARF